MDVDHAWAHYCATFQMAARWYQEHPSDELLVFLIAMEPVWPPASFDPENWPEWLDITASLDGDAAADADEWFATAADYVEMWGERDPEDHPGVRTLASTMTEPTANASLRQWWEAAGRQCRADPASVGGPYAITRTLR